ncbi:MAG TPA: hypothetical protein VF134_01155 [Candidatus Dormibacteraeota bacterium]
MILAGAAGWLYLVVAAVVKVLGPYEPIPIATGLGPAYMDGRFYQAAILAGAGVMLILHLAALGARLWRTRLYETLALIAGTFDCLTIIGLPVGVPLILLRHERSGGRGI